MGFGRKYIHPTGSDGPGLTWVMMIFDQVPVENKRKQQLPLKL
jgi:hypothetical protein